VIAEGVETVTHGKPLLRLGYEQAQGLRYRAADAGLPAWIESWKPPPSCLFITLRKRA